MLKVLVFVLFSFKLSQAFEVDGWIKKHCVLNKEFDFLVNIPNNFFCENAVFSSQELKDIKTGRFIISNHKNIVFEGGNIGIFDEIFLNKFPHSDQIVFIKVKLRLGELNKIMNHPIKNIIFQNCDISGNRVSNIFKNLENLESLYFLENKFEHSILGRNLIGDIPTLKSVTLYKNNFMKIDDNAFEGSNNLEKLCLSNNLDRVSEFWFSEMNNMKVLNLSENHLREVPCKVLPGNLEELSLSSNNIRTPRFEGCHFLESIRRLYLGKNYINGIGIHIFDKLVNLEELALENNGLKTFSSQHVKNLRNLVRLNLSGNNISDTDINENISLDL